MLRRRGAASAAPLCFGAISKKVASKIGRRVPHPIAVRQPDAARRFSTAQAHGAALRPSDGVRLRARVRG